MADKEYEVEAILDKRSLPGEEVRYLIKWKGWDRPEDNTWERLSKLGGCKNHWHYFCQARLKYVRNVK